jgi:hypothetical protein
MVASWVAALAFAGLILVDVDVAEATAGAACSGDDDCAAQTNETCIDGVCRCEQLTLPE